MLNVILLADVVEGFDEWCTVVRYDFCDHPPMVDDVSNDPITDRLRSFSSQHVEFGPMCDRTTSLDDVLEATRRRQVHSIDVDLCEQGGWSCDCRGNENVACLSSLADVARLDEPGNIVAHERPPISKCNESVCREVASMTSVVVS